MAQQTINISTPNSNAGDTIRDSFDKCNDNFTELYASSGSNLNEVTTAGNTTTNSITVGGLIVDTSTLFVDSTNNRVGIGTTSPSEALSVSGNMTVSGSSFLDGFVTIDHNLNIQASGVIQMGGTEVISATRVIRASSGLFSDKVGIGTTSPSTNAFLDVTSTTKGVLLPRMTTTQVNAISSPENGLTVYNTTLNTLCFYNGTSWQKVTSANM